VATKNEPAPIDPLDDTLETFQKRPWLEWAILLVLCLVMLSQLLLSVSKLSQTEDEAVHLYSGYRYLQCGDLTFSPEHPPLAKMIAALPLLAMNPKVDCTPFRGDISEAFVAAFGWLYSTDWHRELSLARVAVSLFSIFLCVLVWAAARRMFGSVAAILAALLLIFEPNVLAHGALVTTDMAVTAMLLFAVFGFYLWTRKPGIPLLVVAGIAVGLTLLAKNSGVLAIPMLLILAIADPLLAQDTNQRLSKRMLRNLATVGLILLIAWAVLWMGYGMRYSAHPGTPLVQVPSSSRLPSSLSGRLVFALEDKHLLPQAYLEGFVSAARLSYSSKSTPVFILGKFYPGAQWFSLPVHLLIRCTAGFLGVLFLSIAGTVLTFAKYRREVVFLLVPVVLFSAAIIHSSWNAGMRHMLPILPFLIILAAAGSLELAKSVRWIKYALPCLLMLHVASSLHAFPNYLSYGNEFWGGPSHSYQYLGGESDWGQSYWQAKAYMEQHPSEKCWLLTDLMVSDVYGVPCTPIGVLYPGLAPTQMNGTVMVESKDLYSIYPVQSEEVTPFKNIRPTDTIGGSAILVFRGSFDTRETASMSATLRAVNELKNSRLQQARELSDYAIQIAPQSVYGHNVHAAILAKLGDRNAAISELEYARSLVLNNPLDGSLLTVIDSALQQLRTNSMPD
jgi:4-amino-4-deoxy-L-arabinose transferase-like glycosyltransferase